MRNHSHPWFADGLQRSSFDYWRCLASLSPADQCAAFYADRQLAALYVRRLEEMQLFRNTMTDEPTKEHQNERHQTSRTH